MENNNFKEKNIDDAPIQMSNDEASAWVQGYNSALERTKANDLLKAAINTLKWLEINHRAKEKEFFSDLKEAIKQETI